MEMSKKIFLLGVGLVLGMVVASVAFAQDKPEVVVKQRQAAMTLQGKYFGPLMGMAQGKIPYNAEIVARNAGYLNVLDKMPWDGFVPGTQDVKSQALPEVFNDPAKFKTAQERLQGAVAKLIEVKSGNEAEATTAIAEVGKACGGCHENFRQKN
jgi:cytochrome c556